MKSNKNTHYRNYIQGNLSKKSYRGIKKNKQLQKISEFWITPLLIGCLVSLGYNFTKRSLLITKNTEVILPSNKNKPRIKKEYTKVNKGINKSENSIPNQSIEKKEKELSIEKEIEHKLKQSPEEDNMLKTEKVKLTIETRSKKQPLKKAAKEPEKEENKNQLNDFFSLEANEYFEKFNAEELLKTLPSE
ncbi:hypothetical protein [Prochlorococcus sp. MIT 1223]|uniref:hypothetical protein n=1 Tax=Prochlorococcus sp. MIT 1223 TaxID=3096217 RepID=UPI002A74A330|nr:hypothetical protein [Prochlorococcus sp. MIT 1223]